jgi:cytochrome b561
MTDTRRRYSNFSLTLHWATAAFVAAQIVLVALADRTEGPSAGELIGLHKSIGLTILVLTLIRLGVRVRHRAPALPFGTPVWQRILARGTHVGFYLLLIGMPLGGWAASSAAGRDISFFGLFNWPLLPIGGGREVAGQFMDMHELGAKALYVLLALHVIGALKHHFVDRDDVLQRMLPFISRRS